LSAKAQHGYFISAQNLCFLGLGDELRDQHGQHLSLHLSFLVLNLGLLNGLLFT
jgi:hypothetical protein